MSDAEAVLQKLLEQIAREHNFDRNEISIKAITSGGANYTSALFLVTVKSSGNKDVELFAKVACVGEKLRQVMLADRLYYLEAQFYNKLSKIYKELELKRDVPEDDKLVIPKFYGCNTTKYEETIVLENLIATGFGSYSRFISVDWDHAAASIEALAKFHAMSFAYQKDDPEGYEEVCKDIVFVEHEHDAQTRAIFGQFIERALSVLKEEYRPRIAEFVEKVGDRGMYKFRNPLGTKAIIHGDYRPSNLLYKRQGNKVHAIPVDFQTIHVGSPAADFIYFELCGTDSDFRAAHHDRLVQHYYDELSAALQRLGVDVTEVYPREVLDSELKELLPFSVLLGVFLLPIVLVEAEQAPRLDGDKSIETFMVPSNELFAERFTGLVEDCVRQGVI